MDKSNQTNHTSSSELWPLFGNDSKQARHCIQRLLKEKPTHQLLHLAISTGNAEEIHKLPKQYSLSINTKTTLNYRLHMKKGNLTEALNIIASQAVKNLAKDTINQSIEEQKPIPVLVKDKLGIGDHLETYCFMKNYQKTTGLRFHIVTGKHRARLMQRYLNEVKELSGCDTEQPCLEINPYKYWLHQTPSNYFRHPLLDLNQNKSNRLLCCWQAEGARDPFSKHSRSIPFDLVHRFYTSLIKNNPTISITDITTWKPWQQQSLATLGIQFHNPSQSDVLGLAKVASKHRWIISIDTALAHLCAVTNLKAHLLLNLHPDERWSYLLQADTCYSKNLTIHRQSSFGDWTTTMKNLIQSID